MEEPNNPYNSMVDQTGVHTQAQQSNLLANQSKQLQYQMEDVEKNLAEAQLDVEETLTKINHLLKQDSIKTNEQGILEWQPIDDDKEKNTY